MKINVILFDLDGTLIDTTPRYFATREAIFKDLNIQCPSHEDLRRVAGLPFEKMIAEFIPADRVKEAVSYYQLHYRQLTDKKLDQPVFGAWKVLSELKKMGMKLGIVSSKQRILVDAVLSAHHAQHFFKLVMGKEDASESKPSPKPLLTALERLGCRVDEAIYVGDTVQDAEAAFNAKMAFVGVLSGTGIAEEFEKYSPKAIFPSVADLPQFLLA